MRPLDRHAVAPRELGRPSAVVDVPVGEEHLLQSPAGLAQRVLDPVEVAAGVDHGGCGGVGVDQDRAVLGERRDRDDRERQRHGDAQRDAVGR
jgi:hypothetical protein